MNAWRFSGSPIMSPPSPKSSNATCARARRSTERLPTVHLALSPSSRVPSSRWNASSGQPASAVHNTIIECGPWSACTSVPNTTSSTVGAHGLEDSGGRVLDQGDVLALDANAIHSVANPSRASVLGLHVYGGDIDGVPRSQWRPDGTEGPVAEVRAEYLTMWVAIRESSARAARRFRTRTCSTRSAPSMNRRASDEGALPAMRSDRLWWT